MISSMILLYNVYLVEYVILKHYHITHNTTIEFVQYKTVQRVTQWEIIQ